MGTDKKVRGIVFVLATMSMAFANGCSKDNLGQQSNSPSSDPMFPCNIAHIYHDDYLSFDKIDSSQFAYSGHDTLKFIRNNKDTFFFIGQGKNFGQIKVPIAPCEYYFNYWDTSVFTFVCANWNYPILILQSVRPKSDYGGYQFHNPLSKHVFEIRFNNITFRGNSEFIDPGNYIEIPSTTLLSYNVFIEPGIIKKFVLQGGEIWWYVP